MPTAHHTVAMPPVPIVLTQSALKVLGGARRNATPAIFALWNRGRGTTGGLPQAAAAARGGDGSLRMRGTIA